MENLENDKNAKKGSFLPLIIMMIASALFLQYGDKVPIIKDSVSTVLNPSVGVLLNWNLTGGMMIVVFAIALLTTLVQKYTTDQKALRELREEQKILNEEMKKFRDNPEKIIELNKKQMDFIPKTMKLTSRSILYTGIPFILFFKWFTDFFTSIGSPKFFGFLSWFWFYFIFTLVFSSFLRKWLKVV